MFRRVAEDGNAAREDLLDSLHLLCALCYTGVCPRHREMTVMCAQHDLQLRNCKEQAAHAQSRACLVPMPQMPWSRCPQTPLNVPASASVTLSSLSKAGESVRKHPSVQTRHARAGPGSAGPGALGALQSPPWKSLG